MFLKHVAIFVRRNNNSGINNKYYSSLRARPRPWSPGLALSWHVGEDMRELVHHNSKVPAGTRPSIITRGTGQPSWPASGRALAGYTPSGLFKPRCFCSFLLLLARHAPIDSSIDSSIDYISGFIYGFISGSRRPGSNLWKPEAWF